LKRSNIGARDKIREFLEGNVGKIVTTEQIARIAKIRDYQRRIRELRNDEGMQILSRRDRPDLKPNEYLLVSLKREPRLALRIDKAQRTRIIERDGLICSMCGVTPSDPDLYYPGRKITLHIDHDDRRGPTIDENLRVFCRNCKEGRSNLVVPPAPNTLSVIRTIRRLPRSDQRLIFLELKKKFEPTT
jgi:hypothetical protein